MKTVQSALEGAGLALLPTAGLGLLVALVGESAGAIPDPLIAPDVLPWFVLVCVLPVVLLAVGGLLLFRQPGQPADEPAELALTSAWRED